MGLQKAKNKLYVAIDWFSRLLSNHVMVYNWTTVTIFPHDAYETTEYFKQNVNEQLLETAFSKTMGKTIVFISVPYDMNLHRRRPLCTFVLLYNVALLSVLWGTRYIIILVIT